MGMVVDGVGMEGDGEGNVVDLGVGEKVVGVELEGVEEFGGEGEDLGEVEDKSVDRVVGFGVVWFVGSLKWGDG
ncbi:hypothetical protein, partial [Neisseria sicca]|uniref:hypothetical protein n=1 Tax=Neisseria sicca TaxID=490 RepID=UPI001C996BB3